MRSSARLQRTNYVLLDCGSEEGYDVPVEQQAVTLSMGHGYNQNHHAIGLDATYEARKKARQEKKQPSWDLRPSKY
jgi:hypothetical protein